MKVVPALAVLALIPCSMTSLMAVEFGPVGPRSLAMGGTSVANATDGLAALHNPAYLATAPRVREGEEGDDPEMAGRFGWNVVDVSMGITLTGRIGDYLDTIGAIDIDALSNKTTLTEQDVRDALKLSNALVGVDNLGNGLLVQGGTGTAVRLGNISVGARFRAHVGVRVDELDTANLGFSNLNIAGLNTQINAAAGGGGQTGSILNADQKQILQNAGLNLSNVNYLDFLLTDLVNSGQVQGSDIAEAVDLLSQIVQQSNGIPGGDLNNNTTVVTGRGLGLAEIPIAYGYEVTPELSVGATLRLLMGRVYGTTYLVFRNDNDQVIDDIDNNYKTTTTATVDLGLRYQYGRLTLAAVGRNLTAPKFKGFTTTTGALIKDVTLDPQVTVGANLVVLPRLQVAVEGDLLKNDSMLRGLAEQYLRVGVEWDPIRVLELRVGAYDNIAQSDLDLVLTGGVGLDFGAVRFDLSGAVSPFDTVDYDGTSYPQSAMVSFGIAAGF